MRRYNIYPSLMDAYCWMCASDNRETAEAEFLAKVNREPQPTTRAQARGTALNNIIDLLAFGKDVEAAGDAYVGTADGYRFRFATNICKTLATSRRGALAQMFFDRVMKVGADEVRLYGYPDYLVEREIIDLKTTADYKPGKYRNGWQRYVYPFIVGEYVDVERFTFLVAELAEDKTDQENGIITGRIFEEAYPVKGEDVQKVADFLACELLPWLNDHRAQITNERIFQ